MITIEFDLQKLHAYVSELESKLTDRTRLFSDFIIQASTITAHPGNIAHFGPSEMIWGIDGGYFEAVYGENYSEKHETGDGVPWRPVYDLITVGGRLDENIEQLTEKWVSEEIAEVEQRLF